MPTLWCRLLSCCHCVSHVMYFFESFSDDMNIAYVAKNNPTIRVGRIRTTIFVSTALELIRASIKKRSSIIDIHKSRLIQLRTITLANLTNKLFISSIPCAEKERARLTASPNWSTSNFIEITQGWKTVRRAKPCTFLDASLVNLSWEDECSWVWGAQIVSRIVKQLKESFSLLWDLTNSYILIKVTALTLEFFCRTLVNAPNFLVKLKKLNCTSQSALLKYTFCSLRGHQGHLVYNMIIHLNGKEVAHLSFGRYNILQECYVADHVL